MNKRQDCQYTKSLKASSIIAALFGSITISLVFAYKSSGSQQIFHIARFLSDAGNNIFLLASNAILIFWALSRRRTSVIKLTLFLNLCVGIAVQLTKLIPFGEWALRPGALPGGFPSGHAAHAFAMAMLLTTFMPRTWWIWYLLASAIAWSRVELFEHTDLQVAAGVLFGVLITWSIISHWNKRQQAKNADDFLQPQQIPDYHHRSFS